tara:strand:- start:136 stop:294 length:159 start_codon:yes stop_codon:yes gene_type:complete
MTKKSDDLTFNYFDMFVFCKQCRKMQIEKIETTIDEHIEKRESGYGYSVTVE